MHDKIKIPNNFSNMEHSVFTILHDNKPRKISANERLKRTSKNVIKANLSSEKNQSLKIPCISLRRQDILNYF